MSIETTKATMQRYLDSAHGDASTLTEDVAFTVMATGQENRGRDGVLGMLNYFYHVAFDAAAEPRVTIFGENNALWEGEFVGKHIGEFAGVPATGKNVRVPLAVVYDLENGKIKRGRIYFEVPALLQQLGVQMG
ncbi:MAG: ester cyclase [Anaerolineales bacterium]|nr:ester cyclase [Anaerolineales bacterium]